jgi:hypothetical protein
MIKAIIPLMLMIVPAYADSRSHAQARDEHALQQQLDLINAGRYSKGLPIMTMDQLKAQRVKPVPDLRPCNPGLVEQLVL